jgi:hypothetical protein
LSENITRLRILKHLTKVRPFTRMRFVNDDDGQLSRIVDGSAEMIVEVFLEGMVLFIDGGTCHDSFDEGVRWFVWCEMAGT